MTSEPHERALPEVFRVRRAPEVERARMLFCEYAASLPIDLEYQGFRAELESLPGAYAPPQGELLIARSGDQDAGCIALRRIDEGVCEIKRLYVRPAHRARGVGAILVDKAIEAARTLGYREIRLDTLPSMTSAHALYASRGFNEISRYGGPAAPGTRYYGLRLNPERA